MDLQRQIDESYLVEESCPPLPESCPVPIEDSRMSKDNRTGSFEPVGYLDEPVHDGCGLQDVRTECKRASSEIRTVPSSSETSYQRHKSRERSYESSRNLGSSSFSRERGDAPPSRSRRGFSEAHRNNCDSRCEPKVSDSQHTYVVEYDSSNFPECHR